MFAWSPFAEPSGEPVVVPPFDQAVPLVEVELPLPLTDVPPELPVAPLKLTLIFPLPPDVVVEPPPLLVDFKLIVSLLVDLS